jgi:voltage-gated potassium channel
LTLLLPTTLANLGFLRILRLWSMSRSGFLGRPLEHLGLGLWRDTGHAFVNLITFLFVITGFLYTFLLPQG